MSIGSDSDENKFNVFSMQNLADGKYVRLDMNILNNDIHYFLIDTGADISLIEKSCINGDILCYPDFRCNIVGIGEGKIQTLAQCEGIITVNDGVPVQSVLLEHSFQVVPANFPIPCSGILGNDFFRRYRCKIDYFTNAVEIPLRDNASVVVLNICNLPEKLYFTGKI